MNTCKKIYITDDNPRNESPQKIRNELKNIFHKSKAFNIGKRSLAIKKAIKNAHPNEIILVAGKGHEEQQIYKNKILNISDKKIIKKFYTKIKILTRKEINYHQNQLVFNNILGKKILNFDGLSIDTRTIKKENLFLALKGKKNDGNKFIYDALKKDAGCIVTSSSKKKKKNN